MRLFKAVALIIGSVTVVVWLIGAAMVGMSRTESDNGYDNLPKCVTEDQEYGPCYWFGGDNGEGTPFYVDEWGNVFYQEQA